MFRYYQYADLSDEADFAAYVEQVQKAAQAAGIAYDKVVFFPASHAAYYPGAQSIAMKVLYEKESLRLLGAQIIGGEGVDKRIDVLATAIRAKMTALELTELDLSYAPPYSSAKDPVNMVGFMIEDLESGKVRQFHWNEHGSILHIMTIDDVVAAAVVTSAVQKRYAAQRIGTLKISAKIILRIFRRVHDGIAQRSVVNFYPSPEVRVLFMRALYSRAAFSSADSSVCTATVSDFSPPQSSACSVILSSARNACCCRIPSP